MMTCSFDCSQKENRVEVVGSFLYQRRGERFRATRAVLVISNLRLPECRIKAPGILPSQHSELSQCASVPASFEVNLCQQQPCFATFGISRKDRQKMLARGGITFERGREARDLHLVG